MIPGEIQVADGDIELNSGRATVSVSVANHGDRPVQVGSHYHFYEVNQALVFDRAPTLGFRLTSPPAPRCVSSPARRAPCNWWPTPASARCTAFRAR